MDTHKISTLAMLLSLSVVLSLIETLIPFSFFIPGLKLGLANVVVLYVIIKYRFKDAVTISLLRVFLVSLLRTGLFNLTFFLSISGAIISVIVMKLIYKKVSVIKTSIIGALGHNIGQIIMAIILLKTPNIIYYLPFLIMFSIPSGIIVGIIVNKVLSYDK